MSIADKLTRLDDVKSEIRTAITEKGQAIEDTDTFFSYADKIRQIESGGGAVGAKEIIFYDYDGTILYSYSIAEFATRTEMPPPPTHERLVFQEWNWSLADIKAMGRAVDVGATYTTASGKSEFDLTLTAVTGLDVTMRIYNVTAGNTITVEWGDGTSVDAPTTTAGEKIFTHTYGLIGEYTVTVDSTGSYRPYGTTTTPFNMFNIVGSSICTAVRFGDRCSSVTTYAFRGCYVLQTITLRKGMTSAGVQAFQACRNLRHITFPYNFQTLGEDALYNCTALQSVSTPSRMTNTYYYRIFYGCYALRRMIIPTGDRYLEAESFYNCFALQEVIIPNGISNIESSNFRNCYALQNIVIPDSVVVIGGYTFYYCYNLRSIVIPDGVTEIGSNTFYYCYNLRNVTMSINITSIGASAFQYCYNLENIMIPEKVTSIAASAFGSCTNIKKYTLKSVTPPSLANINVFTNISQQCIIEVPKGSLQAYQTATNWATYAAYMREAEE